MHIDQIELLVQDTSRTPTSTSSDARRLIDRLPVKNPTAAAEAVRTSISQEPEDPPPPGESPWMQGFLTGLSWVTYACVVAVAVYLAWGAADIFTLR